MLWTSCSPILSLVTPISEINDRAWQNLDRENVSGLLKISAGFNAFGMREKSIATKA